MVELLAVMLIISIVTVVSLPALASLTSAGGVNQATNGLSLLLDQCRAYAMARNTYVWVGFTTDPAAQTVTAGAVAGKTGQASDLNLPATYAQAARPRTYNNLLLVPSLAATANPATDTLPGMHASATDVSASKVAAFTQSVGAKSVSLKYVLQFSPQGEATIANGAAHWIQIILQPTHGGNASSPNFAVLQLAALTGQVQVFRP